MSSKTQRVNISFPKKLVDELSSLVPSGKRSHLVVEATQKELQRIRRLKILEKTAGVWKDSSHPDLKTIRDVCNWVNRLRQSDEERLSKIVKGDA
jgi:metal-responsive CopG/Arc/MetJ family transcriptional regulator